MVYLVRVLLLFFLAWLIARAIWRVVAGVIVGASAPPPARRPSRGPERGVQMVRDPVCGTFLPPANALTLDDREGVKHFCSEACLRKYEAGASKRR